MSSTDSILNKTSSWDDFWKLTKGLSNQEKGHLFERLTELVLKSKPEYVSLVKRVWRQSEGIPTDVREHLRLPKSDEGIDLIAETHRGEYWAIQCKFKGDHSAPTYKEISTFGNLAHNYCKNISRSFLFHTGEKGVLKKKLLGDTFTQAGLEFWLGLTVDDWKAIKDGLSGKTIRPKPRLPRPHQEKAIRQAKEHFIKKKASRGKLIMPCGTGKSLTAFWITQALKSKNVIVAVPSLSLIKQSLEDWTRELLAINEKIRPEWLCICSDDSTGKLEKDEFVSDIYSLGIPTTTDPKEIKSFISRPSKGKKIIFTTYQSSDRLAQVAKSLKFTFDLAILDEAHKTVGEKSKAFATLLFDKNISIRQRIFMTATERVVRGKNDEVLSMDDKSIYGDRFYLLTFKEAIHSNPPIISDYKIITVMVTNDEINELIEKNKLLTDKSKKLDEKEAQAIAAVVALRKSYEQYGIKHAVSFHSSISRADDFTTLNDTLSKTGSFRPIKSYHISSKKSAGDRAQLLRDFSSEKLSLITNARCLTEGVDVPSIDCVLFADPRQSVVDIVQASGRALRNAPGKKYGYIMLPIVVPDGMELNEFAETTPYKQIVRIISALSTQDERIAEEFRIIDSGKRVSKGRIINITGSVPVGLKTSFSDFADGIETKIWDKVGKVNWRKFVDARAFVHKLNFQSLTEWYNYSKSPNLPKDIPATPNSVYKNSGWISAGDWLGTGRIADQLKSFRTYAQAREFARALKLKSYSEWRAFSKTADKPSDIPSAPQNSFENKGWKGWGDFLGTGTIPTNKRSYYTYKKAQSFVKSKNITSETEWREFKRINKLPLKMPLKPETVYKNNGWKGWGDFLGTGNVHGSEKNYWDYSKARRHIAKLNLNSVSDWDNYCSTGNKPNQIPNYPPGVYKNKGWIAWSDFLSNGKRSNNESYRSFHEARSFIHKLKLKSSTEWKRYCKSGQKPKDIPNAPWTCSQYSVDWINLGDWLGTGRIADHLRVYRDFTKAREYVQQLKLSSESKWRLYCKSGKKPVDIPSAPDNTYRDKGWTGWKDWLGNH